MSASTAVSGVGVDGAGGGAVSVGVGVVVGVGVIVSVGNAGLWNRARPSSLSQVDN